MFRGILQRSMVQSLLGLSVSLAWRSLIFLFVCRAAGMNVMPGHRRGVFFRRPSGGISVTRSRMVQVRVNFVCFLSSLSCCHASQTP